MPTPIRPNKTEATHPQCFIDGESVRLETAKQAWMSANPWSPKDAEQVFKAAIDSAGEDAREQLLDAGIEIVFSQTVLYGRWRSTASEKYCGPFRRS